MNVIICDLFYFKYQHMNLEIIAILISLNIITILIYNK